MSDMTGYIPFIELRRLYQIDKITKQYQALGNVLGIPFEDHEAEAAALDSVKRLKSAKPDAVFAIGECMNGDPFELALALVKYGFRVAEIYGTLTAENFVYLKNLSELSPQTKGFSFSGKNKSRDESIFQYGTNHAVL